MKHASSRALYAYWDRLRASRAAPERSDLDPGAIRTTLGDVFLLELAPGDRQTVRLAGTRICTLLGREWTGHPFAEPFAPEDRFRLLDLVGRVADTALPAVAAVVGRTADGRMLDLEMLVLPLRHRGRTRARVLGALSAADWPYWAGGVPLVQLHLTSAGGLQPATADDIDLVGAPSAAGYPALRVLPGGRT
ncbi:MAG: PAS domain-containing protein [Bradyrhizobiaceae bacterium]|nr:PAS domain-containing protein [Bradyrhizobiaceae bacterium]